MRIRIMHYPRLTPYGAPDSYKVQQRGWFLWWTVAEFSDLYPARVHAESMLKQKPQPQVVWEAGEFDQ